MTTYPLFVENVRIKSNDGMQDSVATCYDGTTTICLSSKEDIWCSIQWEIDVLEVRDEWCGRFHFFLDILSSGSV